MKLLCIDSGNTRIKWSLREDDTWREQGTATSAQIERLSVAADRIIAANVGGVPSFLAIEALAQRLNLPLRWVQAQAEQCGVRNGYQQPEQLGADRWAALIGARGLHCGDCLVVMCGTATTIDLLCADGCFEGGVILPGLDLMRKALAEGTADLPAVTGRFTERPRNTVDAIASGAVQATAGAIERMFGQLDAMRDRRCLLSGGAAGEVSSQLACPHRVIDNLVLEGLAAMRWA
jgi:type III pantothenate kinase